MTDSSERLHRPKADTIEISDLLTEARAGKYELPDFQRDLEWKEEDRIKLFDSIYRGFPIGDILFWEPEEPRQGSNQFGPFHPPIRIENPWLVVDGQQRLSTLFGCLLLSEYRLEAHEDWRFAFDTDKLRIVRLPQIHGPELLPLPIAIDTAQYLKWTRTLPDERRDERMQAGDDFSKALRTYRIPYYVVRTRDRRLLQQVFERVNTTGKSLSGTDVFNALFPTRLNAIAEKLESLGFGLVEPDWLLQAAKVMVGMDPAGQFGKQLNFVEEPESTSEIPGLWDIVDEAEAKPMREMLKEIGPGLEKAATSAIRLLREIGIQRVEILPYALILPILIHFFHKYADGATRVRLDLIRFAWHVSAGVTTQRNRATYLRAVARIIRESSSPEIAIRELVDYSRGSGRVTGESLAAHHDWRSGSTRLVALALFECQPRELTTGELIPVWHLLPTNGHEMFQRIWTRGTDGLGASSANRIISVTRSPQSSRYLENMAARERQETLFGEDAASPPLLEALESQAITSECLVALRTGDRVGFLELRANRIAKIVDAFLERRLI